MSTFTQHYQEKVIPKLKEGFSYVSDYTLPKIEKVVINVGFGDLKENDQAIKQLQSLVAKISGQAPVLTKARTAVSGFKIRQGMDVGMKTTLRGKRMNDFLQKLITVALPRTRDFRGLPQTAITDHGSLHIGVKDSIIFPEVAQDVFQHSLQVTLVAKTKSREEARLFYESLGFVFSK